MTDAAPRTPRTGRTQRASAVAVSLALAASFAAWLMLAPTAVRAAPLPEDRRGPVDLRRTTLVVRDIERSLPLYRDALGLTVVYDQLIGGGTDASGKPTPPTIRLVLLRANDDFVGMLGLMQRLNETPPPARSVSPDAKAHAGEPILVINAKDLETRFARIAAVPGVTVATRPTPVEYPSPDGGTIAVLFSAIWDPDGFFVEINQLRGTAAGTAKKQ